MRLGDKLLLENARDDLATVYSAMDIVCLTSVSEGFSNVLGEAMACSRTCVATDVGDSNWIVDKTGLIVSPQNAEQLTAAVLQTAESDLADSGERSRNRINNLFSVDALISTSERLLIDAS